MPSPPLAHVRVVDLADLRGAFAGRILADLGADVVKIEPPGGDPGRRVPPFAGGVPGDDRSLPFLYRNLGKRGAVVDLDTAEGWRRFVRLCDRADVLVENIDPGDGLGERLAPPALRARHPHLVHLAIADLGRSGPRAGWRLEALPAFAASGALWASGFPGRPPCWLPGFQAHDAAAIIGVTGVLAALLDRNRHGRGQTVEVSVQEAGMAALDPWGIVLPDYAHRYPILPRTYPRDGDGPAIVVRVTDGWVRVLAVSPKQWAALVALLTGREPSVAPETGHRDGEQRLFGHGTWGIVGAGLSTLAGEGVRVMQWLPGHPTVLSALHAAVGALRMIATEALAGRSREEVVKRGLALGLPIAPVHRPEEFVAAEQTRVRGYFRRTGFPHLGDAPVAIFPANLGATPAIIRRPAPAAGEDGGDFPPRPRVVPHAPDAMGPVLSGIRVVNLGVGAVAPEACGMLAHLGAEVVKIESAASPDFLRRLTVDPTSPDGSFTFNDENRGQRSVCLDLGTERGRALALRLCGTADVVVENRRGGLVERVGLDYEAVRRVRPDVVYVSSQGYGSGGPLGSAPAYGPLNAAFAGITWLWNHPDPPHPGGSSLEHPDHIAGKLLAVAVLAALAHRARTGHGQRIELAQTEAAAYLLGEFYLHEPCTGRPVVQRGNAVEYACPHGVYPAAGDDRWIAIAVVGDDRWARFCRALDWGTDARLATLAGRLAVRPALDARVAAWTRELPAEEAAATLQAAGVSAFPVQAPADQRSDPHLDARGALVRLQDPEAGAVLHVGNPLRLGDTGVARPRPAPRLGEDTESVLRDLLGLTAEQVRELVADGIAR